MTKDKLKTAKAVMFGLACGDALGWPTEFKSMDRIWASYGQTGIVDLSQTNGEFTDDTQMTLAVADALLKAADEAGLDMREKMRNLDWVAPRIAHEFVQWSRSPENNRAPGSTCMAGCNNLAKRLPWRAAGIKDARGCGAVMRVAPIGLVYDDENTLKAIAEMSSALTHDSEMCRRSAHLGALAINLIRRGVVKTAAECQLAIFEEADRLEKPPTKKLVDLLLNVDVYVQQTISGKLKPWEVQDRGKLGQSWEADEALASALYCVLLAEKRGEGLRQAVAYGANTPGDSDSIASIAGGIAGALWGIGGDRGLPVEWLTRIEKPSKLDTTARLLHALNLSLA